MTPLQLTGLLMHVDVEGTVQGGGMTSRAGAVRLAVSKALQSFVSHDVRENMRIGVFCFSLCLLNPIAFLHTRLLDLDLVVKKAQTRNV